ncbi:MAG: FAD-dependent monooxygenase, partial [Chromatiaceae bacterium]|nr:FAD-dependent monooxygenase [Chromatiaceae bacterium]
MKTNHIDPCCDVLIIGGGPAGSTAAALLGEK